MRVVRVVGRLQAGDVRKSGEAYEQIFNDWLIVNKAYARVYRKDKRRFNMISILRLHCLALSIFPFHVNLQRKVYTNKCNAPIQ